jgi:hypothetical protein
MRMWLIAVMIVLAVIAEGPCQFVPVAAPDAVAGEPEGWYAFNKDMQQCELQLKGPADWMALSDKLGEHYTNQWC